MSGNPKYVLTSHFPTPQIVLNVSPKTPNQNKISTFFQQPQIFQNHQLSQHFSKMFLSFPSFSNIHFSHSQHVFTFVHHFCHISQQFPGIFPGFLAFYSWVSHVFSAAGRRNGPFRPRFGLAARCTTGRRPWARPSRRAPVRCWSSTTWTCRTWDGAIEPWFNDV